LLAFVRVPPPATPTVFPYTTLFRSPREPVDPRAQGDRSPAVPADLDRTLGVRAHPDGPAGTRLRPSAHAPAPAGCARPLRGRHRDRKSTRLNSSHVKISYAVFCLKK